MKNKGLLIAIIVIVVIALGCGGYFLFFNKNEEHKTKDEPKEVIKTHVAYIKINPSIKVEYTEKCIEDACEEPVVTKYELLNDDAKELFKNINLLDGDKTLAAVVEKICETAKENDYDVSNVEIVSDWKEINSYIEENKEATDTWNYNVQEVQPEQIDTVIEKKVQEDIKKTEDNNTTVDPNEDVNNQGTTEPTTPSNQTTTNRNNSTIYLSDNVTYTIGGEGYCCNKCFSDALVKEVSNAKGYYTVKADNSTIDFRKITLSSPYNTANYTSTGIKEKLISAGGENCSGLGGETGKLTKELCDQFHLTCE